MSGTHVFYNGVELRDCTTKVFDQQMMVDDSGNHLTSKFRIRVESLAFGFFNGEASFPSTQEQLLSHPSTIITKNTSGTDVRGTATDRMIAIQRLLKEPRKDFFMATHGGKREDMNESIYQIMLAATGPDDCGSAIDQKYFKNVLGGDLLLRYALGFNDPASGASLKIARHNVVDTANGPKPIDASITEIYGGKAFRLSFEIEVHRHLCLNQDAPEDSSSLPFNLKTGDGAKSNPFVLSNTWSSDETCGEDFRRTRSVEGTLRVRDGRYIAHAFRYLCIPGLLPGYRRISQRFASDSTNLVLKYRVEDRQAEAAPPAPAIDWVMRHVDSSKNEFGMVERQLSIKLIGLPNSSKEDLLACAIRLLDIRFPRARVHGVDFRKMEPRPLSVTGMFVDQNSKDPVIDLSCNIRQHLAGVGGFEQAVEASTQPLAFAGYNPKKWPTPLPFDSDTPAGIFACYFQRPCSQWHGMPKSQELVLADSSTENNVPTAVVLETGESYWEQSGYAAYHDAAPNGSAPLDPDTELTYDVQRSDQVDYPYQYFEVDSRYVSENGNMTLPLSKPRSVAFLGNTRVQSCVTIAVHAGVMVREITIKGSRHGAPVEFPEPAPFLIDENRVVETLSGEPQVMVLDAPEAEPGQNYRVFSAQMKLRYVLDRPLTIEEKYRMGNRVNLQTGPQDNTVFGSAIFGRGRVEHHATSYPASPGSSVDSEVLDPTISNATVGRPL